MTDKLKPCMCGSTDLEILHSATYFVWCHKCFAKGSPSSSREEAVSSWNTRPIEDALLVACKAAYDAIKTLPDDTFGSGYYADHIHGTQVGYWLRDEILHNIAAALAKARGEA